MTIEEKRERAKRYKVGGIYYFMSGDYTSKFIVLGIEEMPRSVVNDGDIYIIFGNTINGIESRFLIGSFMDEHSIPKADFYKL